MKKKLTYKGYYHALVPSVDGLQCFGSNLPDHPTGSCLNPEHPLVYPNLRKRVNALQELLEKL